MNTAKHLNGLNWRRLPKKPFQYWIKDYLPAMLLASLIGTLLDLFFVGSHIYTFPIRPLAEVYTINMLFTLVVLPIFILFFLFIMGQVNHMGKAGVILLISLLMPILEKLAEAIGFFSHSDAWKHLYTFFGYLIYLTVIYFFHVWFRRQ